jgi:hypothetical protein
VTAVHPPQVRAHSDTLPLAALTEILSELQEPSPG